MLLLRSVIRVWIAVAIVSAACENAFSDEIFRSRFDNDGDNICIQVSAESKHLLFLFDTLKHFTAVDVTFKHLLGRERGKHTNRQGELLVTHLLYEAPEVSIGGLKWRGANWGHQDWSKARQASGIPFDGVLGLDWMKDATIIIDPDEGTLEKSEAFDKSRVKGWTNKNWFENEEHQFQYVLSQTPKYFDLEPFLLAIGDELSVGLREELFDKLVRAGEITECKNRQVLGGTQIFSGQVGRLKSIRFAGSDHKDLSCMRMPVNLIGNGILRRYHTAFAYSEKQMYLAPAKRFGEPDPRDYSGMSLIRPDGKPPTVELIDDGSSAHAAGIRKGDEIVAIGKTSTSTITLAKVRLAFRSPGTVTLNIRRGELISSVTLQMQPTTP